MNKNLKVNFHIDECCNYNCGFCFARNHSNKNKCFSSHEDKIEIIKSLAESKIINQINFAGGEPLLDNHISEYIKLAYDLNLSPSLITNGSKLFCNNELNKDLLNEIIPYLSMLGISFHSFDNSIKKEIGFCDNSGFSLSFEHLQELCSFVNDSNNMKKSKCKIKINTVINKFNCKEILKDKIELLNIDRWKCLRCQPFDKNRDFLITDEEYNLFLQNNKTNCLEQIPEDDMSDSYIMINPKGQLKQKRNLDYTYSLSVLEKPFDKLFETYIFNEEKYKENHK